MSLRSEPRNYTRWRQVSEELLEADLLGFPLTVSVDTGSSTVVLSLDGVTELSPDEARLLGVRLIDAAVLADGGRAIRSVS